TRFELSSGITRLSRPKPTAPLVFLPYIRRISPVVNCLLVCLLTVLPFHTGTEEGLGADAPSCRARTRTPVDIITQRTGTGRVPPVFLPYIRRISQVVMNCLCVWMITVLLPHIGTAEGLGAHSPSCRARTRTPVDIISQRAGTGRVFLVPNGARFDERVWSYSAKRTLLNLGLCRQSPRFSDQAEVRGTQRELL